MIQSKAFSAYKNIAIENFEPSNEKISRQMGCILFRDTVKFSRQKRDRKKQENFCIKTLFI